jgi:glycolate oxidase
VKTYAAATRFLLRRLGQDQVLTSGPALREAAFDSSKIAFDPQAVIRPRGRKDLAAVLELANRHNVPVTVRGRGTSLTGSAAPIRGGWVVELLRWNRVRIDATAGLAEVEAGARVADIQRAAEKARWFYPPDPSSREYCTIGGNIACNAGGMHGGKYGVTRDFVIALKGFLPTGEWVEWGTPTRKFAAGFNLRDLWIGSEGMLGIVTDATLRLIPQPASRWTLLAAFANEPSAFRAAAALFRARIRPAICEFLDRYSVACAEAATGATIFGSRKANKGLSAADQIRAGKTNPVILLELAGSESEVAEEGKTVLAWAKAHAKAFRVATGRDEAEALWAVRRKCSGAMFEVGDSKLNEDVVVPLRSYVAFGKYLDRLRRKSGLSIPTFGHLGDGNLHVNIMYYRTKPAEAKAAVKAVKDLMRTVVAMGGAISGEHGIGLAKTPFLSIQHSPAQIEAMKAVKDALDPRGILNPGKMFERFEVWKHARLDVRLPWDHK